MMSGFSAAEPGPTSGDDRSGDGRTLRAALATAPAVEPAWRRLAERALARGDAKQALGSMRRAMATAARAHSLELRALAPKPQSADCRIPPMEIVLEDGTVPIAPYCLKLSGAVVTGDFLAILPTGELLIEGLVPDPAAPMQLTSAIEAIGPSAAIVRKGPLRRVRRAAVLGGSANYYHWLIDCLPRLALLDPTDDRPLIVNDDLSVLQRHSLAALGVAEARLLPIKAGERALVDDLILPSLLTRSSLIHPTALAWLRARLRPEPEPGGPERIFVSRAKAGKRRLTDEEAVAAALGERGFIRLHAEDLTLERQIALFAGAKIIVAPHGAGLSNLVFASPGSTVVEIDVEGSRRSFFSVIAMMVGAAYHRLAGKPMTPLALQDSDIVLGDAGRERLLALIGAIVAAKT